MSERTLPLLLLDFLTENVRFRSVVASTGRRCGVSSQKISPTANAATVLWAEDRH